MRRPDRTYPINPINQVNDSASKEQRILGTLEDLAPLNLPEDLSVLQQENIDDRAAMSVNSTAPT